MKLVTETEYIVGVTAAAFGAAFLNFFGGHDILFSALVYMMILDYVSGIAAAVYRKTRPVGLSSALCFKGILKKVMILVIVAAAHQVDAVVGKDMLTRSMVILFFLGNEGISILEHAASVGLPVPGILKDQLTAYAKGKKEK